MAWFYLLTAAACEMAWPIGLKYTNGFKEHLWAIVGTFAIMGLSYWLLSRAVNEGMSIGNAYALWTGIGAVGTAAIGIAFYHEPRNVARIVCLSLIICGAVGLKFATPHDRGIPAVEHQAK